MNNKIVVLNEEGKMVEIEILDIFNVNCYDKDYILYTMNEKVDENNIITYISILNEKNDNYSLIKIEDKVEEEMVNKAIEENIENLLNYNNEQ